MKIILPFICIIPVFALVLIAMAFGGDYSSYIKNEKLPVCGGNSGQSAKNFSNQILTYCHFSNIVLYWQVYCSCKVKYGNRPSFYFSRVPLIKLRS